MDSSEMDFLRSVVTEVKELRKVCAEQSGDIARLTEANALLKAHYERLHGELMTQQAFMREREAYL